MSTSRPTMFVGGSSSAPGGGESSKSKTTSDLPVLCSRYVLIYTVDDMPDGILQVLTQTNDHMLNAEGSCCEDFGNWSDPHLVHTIILHCLSCKMDLAPFDHLTASYSTYDDAGNKYHLEQKCPKCPNSSQVRILRRGKKNIIGSHHKNPVLDVEVVGQLVVQCHLNVPRYNFNLVCQDRDEQQYHATVQDRLRNPDRSFNLQVEDYEEGYKLRGFRGWWEDVEWSDDFYDALGLRLIDKHCATKKYWPPTEWKSDEDSPSDEDENEDADATDASSEGSKKQVPSDDDDDDGGDDDKKGNGDNVDKDDDDKNAYDGEKNNDGERDNKDNDDTEDETDDADEDGKEEDVGEDQGEGENRGGGSDFTRNVYDGLVMVEREVYGYQGETPYVYQGDGYGEYGTFYLEYQGYSEYEGEGYGQGWEYYHHYQQHEDHNREDDEDEEEE